MAPCEQLTGTSAAGAAALQMGALLIADRQNKRELHALARKCSELMKHAASPNTVKALQSKENTSRALGVSEPHSCLYMLWPSLAVKMWLPGCPCNGAVSQRRAHTMWHASHRVPSPQTLGSHLLHV